MRKADEFDWSDENVGRLRALHAEGMSYQAIADHLGISKYAVSGKASRLHLARRPSPLKSKGVRNDETVRRHAKRRKVTLEPLAPLPVAVVIAPPIPRSVLIAAPPPRETLRCQWIDGDRPRNFVFCNAPRAEGCRSYCAEHAKKAFVKTIPRNLRIAGIR